MGRWWKSGLGVIVLALACRVLAAADGAGATQPGGTLLAPLETPRFWFEAAMKEALEVSAAGDEGAAWDGVPESHHRRGDLTRLILQSQMRSGDVAGAVALAQRSAPQMLPEVADLQRALGDAVGAMATVKLISDPAARSEALLRIGTAQALTERPKDELTATAYEMLARGQSKSGDIVGTQASIKAIADAPNGDGLNDVRRADAYVELATAMANAHDRQGYRDNLATARQLVKGFRPPYEGNVLLKIAQAQAANGDYDDATATLQQMDPQQPKRDSDVVLAAQVKRGDVKPAEALAKASPSSPVYGAVMEVQLAAKDYKAAAETLRKAQGRMTFYEDLPQRIVDGFWNAGDVNGAVDLVKNLTDTNKAAEPAMHAKLYGYLAKKCLAAGDRAKYEALMASAAEDAAHVVDPHPFDAMASPRRSEVLGQLADIQEDAGDFAGAGKMIAGIDVAAERRPYEVECKARELASAGKLQEVQAWMRGLPEAEDRAIACLHVAEQLAASAKQR